jgi:hypothetical protein
VHSLQGSQKCIARVKLVDDPFSTVSAGSGFLPLKDPLRRFVGFSSMHHASIAAAYGMVYNCRLDVPGAEAWEQALDEVPKLIVAGGGEWGVML